MYQMEVAIGKNSILSFSVVRSKKRFLRMKKCKILDNRICTHKRRTQYIYIESQIITHFPSGVFPLCSVAVISSFLDSTAQLQLALAQPQQIHIINQTNDCVTKRQEIRRGQKRKGEKTKQKRVKNFDFKLQLLRAETEPKP